MGPFQKRRNIRDQPAEAAAFQWEYTPVESDGYGPYELLSDQDDRMDEGSSETPAERAAGFTRGKSRYAEAVSMSGFTSGTPLGEDDDLIVGKTAELVPAADSPQTRYLRHSLDTALEHWRAYDEPPSAVLTRRGLEALADGTELSPDQRSLLLRAALYHGAGVLTALQYQDDAELTAIVIAEALTTSRRPLVPEAVIVMRDRDAQGDVWFRPLLHELRYAASGSDVRIRRRAVDALWRLQGEYAALPVARGTPVAASPGGSPSGAEQGTQNEGSGRSHAILGLLVTLAVVATVVSTWYLSRDGDPLVSLPAGQYLLPRDGTLRRVATTGFAIQRYEVTNRDYRDCVTAGRCSPPGASALSGIGAYFDDRAYNNHPVVNVTYAQAAEYCDAQGMRLPSAAEWTLSAGAAPSTGEMLTYPWGNTHEVQRANTLESGIAGPTEVGSFSPAGDSPIGAADMGGNVAEWTMTTGDGGITRVVKGGSYRQSADAARVESQDEIATNGIGDWIGFRCLEATAND